MATSTFFELVYNLFFALQTPASHLTSRLSVFDNVSLSPLINIGIIFITTLLAIFSVPVDVQPSGALRNSALIMAVGLAASILVRFWQFPLAVFDPPSVVAASPIYWLLLDPIQGAYDLPDLRSVEARGIFFAIGLFSGGVWLAAIHRSGQLPTVVQQATEVRFTSNTLFRVASVAFVLAFLRFAIPAEFDIWAMWNAQFQDRWSAPWARGGLGGWDAFLDHFAYFGYMLPTLAVLLSRQCGWANYRTLVAITYSVVIAALLSTGGGRRIIGVLAGSAFLVWFVSARPPKLRHLVGFAGCAVLLLWFMQQMVIYRGIGVGQAFAESLDEPASKLEYLHVDDNFVRVGQLIHIIPEFHPHVGWQWLFWVVVRPVPRVFWAGKPLDPGFSLPDYLGVQGVSLTSSIVGELYMSFGYLGCIVGGWCFGRLALLLRGLLDFELRPGALVLFGSGLLALFAGMRSGIELVLMGYVSMAWVGMVWVYRKVG